MGKLTFQNFYENNDKPKYKIFCDLDGVLTDWNGSFEKISPGKTMDDWKDEGKESEAWDLIHENGKEFWEDMKWTTDGKKLWEFLKRFSPTILSSPGQENVEEVVKFKNAWLDREIGKDQPRIIDRDKQNYADDRSVLIDDTEGNLERWSGADGTGILHKDVDETIKNVIELLGLEEDIDSTYDSKSAPEKNFDMKSFFNTKRLNKRSDVFYFN